MELVEFFNEKLFKLSLSATSKDEAIKEIVDLFHENNFIRNRDIVLQMLRQRESLGSTGIGKGVAIPHGSIDCIDEIVGAVGISKKGIDFESFDGIPVNIVLLLLVPKTKFGKHIKTLAQIARTLSQANIRNRICSAESSEKVLDILEESEREQVK